MATIIELLTSSLGGSLIGTAGAIFHKIHDGKQAVKNNDHEYRMTQLNQAHESAMAQLQLDVKIEEGKASAAIEEIRGAHQSLQSSIENDKATYSLHNGNPWLVFADFLRGTMRSFITAALLFYLGIFLFYITNKYNVALTREQVADIVMQVIQCLLGGSSLALAWWFGTRNINQKG
jgi:hypothetical protein